MPLNQPSNQPTSKPNRTATDPTTSSYAETRSNGNRGMPQ